MATISLWEQESFFAPSDILIVGAGLLGLWSALELKAKKPRLKITIIDRGVIPLGASTRNAGFACFGSPGEMLSDSGKMGENAMWSVVEMRYKGMQKIKQHFSNTEVDYDDCGGYECYDSSKTDLKGLNDGVEGLNVGMQRITGVEQTFKWNNDKMIRFGLKGFDAMIENTFEGGIHSGKLVQSLLSRVQTAGVTVLQGMQVTGWQRLNNIIEVETPIVNLKTEQLLICTNGMSFGICAEFDVEPARGQVLVTAPIAGLMLRGAFHFDEGYYYFRNVGERVLIGGARNIDFSAERSTDFLLNDVIHSELEQFVSRHILPGIPYSVSHRWSGIMGFSENKLPVIKQIDEGVYAALSCNGMGVALSPVIAEQICDVIMG